jgi:hypothetical protein
MLLLRRWRADITALAVLAGLLGAMAWNRVQFDAWLAEFDTLSFYVPFYGHLGERLRDLDVPAWNPHLFGGMPFAGDPQSGWTYALAMLSFTLLKPVAAFKLMVVLQLVIASVSCYALARLLGMAPVAGLAAGVVYGYGPFIRWGAGDGTVMAHVATWIPPALLGVELAVRSANWRWRVVGMWLGALAVSQMVAGWLGQGSVYGLLVVASYIGYRTVLSSPEPGMKLRRRLAFATVVGVAVFGFGLALTAAGLLPRLDANQHTTLSEGYEGLVGTGATFTPMDLDTLVFRLLAAGKPRAVFSWGGAVCALAILAPMLARKRWGVPFFTALTLISLVMTQATTPVHQLFYLFPRFEDLHEHDPSHVLVVAPIGMSMLTAATIQATMMLRRRRRALVAVCVALMLFSAGALYGSHHHVFVGWAPVISGLLALSLVAAAFIARGRTRYATGRRMAMYVPILLIAVLAFHQGGLEFTGSWLGWPRGPALDRYWSENPARDAAIAANGASADSGGAGEFLQQRRDAGEVFRYVGYGGFNNRDDPERRRSHMTWRLDPRITALLVNGRPLLLGIQEIQGYNPVQLRRYAEFITAINGVRTNYHVLYLLPGGTDSPLLDLLNLRYVVLDLTLPPAREDVITLTLGRREVFRNELVAVFEDPDAPPRAWIVHDVRSVPAGEALPIMLDGSLDLEDSALIEGELPQLALPGPDEEEAVRVVSSSSDSLVLETTTTAPGFLVISEMFEPGWQASVDGRDVDILPTNHILQGIALPEGSHTIELRYEPVALRAGLAISGLAIFACVASLAGIALDFFQRRRTR